MKLITVIMVLGTLPLHARLEETIDQSVTRYGAPVEGSRKSPAPNCETMIFVKDGIWIEARFYQDKCCDLIFQKKTTAEGPDPSDPMGADNGPFIPDEISVLLEQNANESHWGKPSLDNSGSFPIILWHRDDGALAIQRGHIIEIKATSDSIYDKLRDDNLKTAEKAQAEKDEIRKAANKTDAEKSLQGL